MWTTISSLIIINLFVVLTHETGFFETIDTMINERYKFHHLPYIFLCGLCQVNWLSLLYLMITGNVTLFTIMLCPLNGLLTRVTQPLYRFVENLMMKVIELLNKWLKL